MTKGQCKAMVEIRDVIHRLRNGQSNRCIERETGTDRSITRKVKELAIVNQWLDLALPMPSDEEITRVWNPKTKTQKPHPLDLYCDDLKQWRQEGHSAVVIHQLLKDKCPCDTHAVRRYLNKHFPKSIEPVMVRPTIPGQDMDIDFGYLGNFLDDGGVLRKAWVFSFRLRHSRRAYRKVVLDQKISTFLMCHVYAFEWFSGVPKNIILDNTKSAIIQCTIDNEMVRRSYQELAEHYGFIISPCLPRTPEHKGGVEGDVKYVKRNFLPYFNARQKEKNIKVSTLRDLIEALDQWGREIADIHIVHGVGRSPLEIFKAEEEKTLRILPKHRWELTFWSQNTVRKDWRIMYDAAYYSVPFQLIGKTVQVCATTTLVRIFFDHKEIAFHERAKKKWEYKRKAEHAPPLHEEVLQCTREGLLFMAEKAGFFIHQVASAILSHPSVDKLRPVRKLLKLANKYSQERLEKACKRASHYKMFSYTSVKNILENNLDQQPLEINAASKVIPLPTYRFARDPADYRSETFEEVLKRLHPTSKHGNAMLGVFRGLLADQIIEEEKRSMDRPQS
jgi:transposase